MKKAIISIDTALLSSMLQLPPEANIEDVMMCFDYPDRLMLRLNGVGKEVQPNHIIEHYVGRCDASGKIEWGLNEQE